MKHPMWYYEVLIESMVSGIVDGETFEEALKNFDRSSEIESPAIFTMVNKSVDDLREDLKPSLEYEQQQKAGL